MTPKKYNMMLPMVHDVNRKEQIRALIRVAKESEFDQTYEACFYFMTDILGTDPYTAAEFSNDSLWSDDNKPRDEVLERLMYTAEVAYERGRHDIFWDKIAGVYQGEFTPSELLAFMYADEKFTMDPSSTFIKALKSKTQSPIAKNLHELLKTI